jgi:hypothetical protein
MFNAYHVVLLILIWPSFGVASSQDVIISLSRDTTSQFAMVSSENIKSMSIINVSPRSFKIQMSPNMGVFEEGSYEPTDDARILNIISKGDYIIVNVACDCVVEIHRMSKNSILVSINKSDVLWRDGWWRMNQHPVRVSRAFSRVFPFFSDEVIRSLPTFGDAGLALDLNDGFLRLLSDPIFTKFIAPKSQINVQSAIGVSRNSELLSDDISCNDFQEFWQSDSGEYGAVSYEGNFSAFMTSDLGEHDLNNDFIDRALVRGLVVNGLIVEAIHYNIRFKNNTEFQNLINRMIALVQGDIGDWRGLSCSEVHSLLIALGGVERNIYFDNDTRLRLWRAFQKLSPGMQIFLKSRVLNLFSFNTASGGHRAQKHLCSDKVGTLGFVGLGQCEVVSSIDEISADAHAAMYIEKRDTMTEQERWKITFEKYISEERYFDAFYHVSLPEFLNVDQRKDAISNILKSMLDNADILTIIEFIPAVLMEFGEVSEEMNVISDVMANAGFGGYKRILQEDVDSTGIHSPVRNFDELYTANSHEKAGLEVPLGQPSSGEESSNLSNDITDTDVFKPLGYDLNVMAQSPVSVTAARNTVLGSEAIRKEVLRAVGDQ